MADKWSKDMGMDRLLEDQQYLGGFIETGASYRRSIMNASII